MSNSISLFENINAINDINDINDISDVNDMANYKSLDLKSTKSSTSSRSTGRASPSAAPDIPDCSSAQEGEGVLESRPDLTLAQEREQFLARGDWITQSEVTYAVVSLWLGEPNNFNSIKAQYAIRTRRGMQRYSVALTQNPYDYIGNVKRRWSDADGSFYQQWYNILKETSQQPGAVCYAGKSLATRTGFNTGRIIRMPITAHAGLLITQDENKWQIVLRHHDFFAVFAIPNLQLEQELQQWITAHAVTMEARRSKRVRNTPPFVRLEWRA